MSTLAPRAEFAPPAGEQPYAPKDIADLIVGSFRFSRGTSEVQNAILQYLARRYQERFAHEIIEESISLTIEQAYRIYTSERAHPFKEAEDDDLLIVRHNVETYIGHFQYYLGNPRMYPMDIDLLSEELLTADEKWLPYQRKRNNKPKLTKPYRSNIIHYGLLDRPTGRAEYDNMFSMVIGDLPYLQLDKQQQFAEIVTQHIHHQPAEREAVEQAFAQATL